jgi:2-polyprenyl-6-methoxyphenol hydroxylase-like FAD-dependent oxidoreductase
VTVVERDRLPAEPAPRAGAPQSHQIHIILARGMAELERLFPGLEAELLAAGAVRFDFPGDVVWLGAAGWSQRFRPGLTLLSCTRALLEWTIQRRLASLPAVTFLEGHEVTGLAVDPGATEVTGVHLRARPSAPAGLRSPAVLGADLTIDASGRGSRMPDWLQAIGYAPPDETVINPYLGYATRAYARPGRGDGGNDDWRMLYIQASAPDNGRFGAVLPVEGDRWLVGLCGYGRDYPPTDDAGFLEFARNLRSPIVYDAIKQATPLSPVHGFRQTSNRWRHYERAERWPERLIVLGDAACTFNPVYGQGITTAALAGATLQDCLPAHQGGAAGGGLTGLAGRAHRELARTTKGVWLLATGEDLRYPATEGARPGLAARLMHRYLSRLFRVMTGNATVNAAFLDVANLVSPPTALLRPSVLIPTLRGSAHELQSPPMTQPARAKR